MLRFAAVALVAAASAFAPPLHANDANHCLQVTKNERGSMCGPNSVLVELRNSCNATIRAQLCLEGADRRAHCGSNNQLTPGDEVSHYECNATGRYRYWGCTQGQGNCGGNQNGRSF